MKQKNNNFIELGAWICAIVILLSTYQSCFAQPYISFQFDVNNVFNLRDNPRMIKQVNGLDYDFEVGAVESNIGVALFYGAFKNASYKNYGVILDYYLEPLERVKMSLGNKYQVTIRDNEFDYLGTTASYFNPRGKIQYDLSFLIVELIAEFTQRNDIDKRIFEGKVGIKYNIKQ